MQRMTVSRDERGQRLDKYLKRRLPLAPASFLYRMLRKKNITLRGRRADGSERVEAGDEVVLFLSDETIGKFSGDGSGQPAQKPDTSAGYSVFRRFDARLGRNPVLYEDENLLLVRKPAGVLSQKASSSDFSMNEWLRWHLDDVGGSDADETQGHLPYRPSVCNRLDRNTGGILLCAKTLQGSRALSAVIRERRIRKTYQMVVHGRITEPGAVEGLLVKDRVRNVVRVLEQAQEASDASLCLMNGTGVPGSGMSGSVRVPGEIPGSGVPQTDLTGGADRTGGGIEGLIVRSAATAYRPVRAGRRTTLLEADLLTGRSHQLRVHLLSIGHPILFDPKYGDRKRDGKLTSLAADRLPSSPGQLLWCTEAAFPEDCGRTEEDAALSPVAGRVFSCPVPKWWEDWIL